MPFSIQKLSHGVSRILETHICESWRCNIWHIQGRNRDLVVDTGMGLWPIADHIAAIRERPILAFCTHSHHDHAGGLFQFINRLGHSAEAEIFANPTRANTVTGLLASSVIKTPPNPAFDASSWCYPFAPLTLEVREGDVIDLGDHVLQTLHLLGHSPGSVGLWEANSGLLFTGDALYDGTLYDHLYHSVPETLVKACDDFEKYLSVQFMQAITKVSTGPVCTLSLTSTSRANAVCYVRDQDLPKPMKHIPVIDLSELNDTIAPPTVAESIF